MTQRINPIAVVRQLRSDYEDQAPLNHNELVMVLSALGKTGIKNVFVRMDSDSKNQVLNQVQALL